MPAPWFQNFQKATRLNIGLSCPPKNMKFFFVKIRILKHRLVLIRHQFLRNAQIEVHFSEIRNPDATRLQGSLCLDVTSTLAQIENSTGALNLKIRTFWWFNSINWHTCEWSHRSFATFVIWWWWNFWISSSGQI